MGAVEILQQLEAGDIETLDEVFRRLYPVAFEAARSRLGGDSRADCEDIALETLHDLLEKGAHTHWVRGLKPFAAAVARNKATDRLRHLWAEKRGGGKVVSLDELRESDGAVLSGASAASFWIR